MSLTQQINLIVEKMPERNQLLILELLKAMSGTDDIASADDVAAHDAALKDYQRGETISHAAINWS